MASFLIGRFAPWFAGQRRFLVMRLIPGDPAALLAGQTPHPRSRRRERLGLNDPLVVQYVELGGVVQGDFGRSFSRGSMWAP